MFRALVVSCVLVLCGACDRELLDHHFAPAELSGSLRVPVTATDEAGNHYRITQATFEISGSAMLTLALDPRSDAALSTPLPAGSYSMFLRPNFRIVRIDDSGAEEPIEATFAASNPMHFQVDQIEAVTLKLAFRLASEMLTFGAAPPVRVTLAH